MVVCSGDACGSIRSRIEIGKTAAATAKSSQGERNCLYLLSKTHRIVTQYAIQIGLAHRDFVRLMAMGTMHFELRLP
jgi:hypothetical protein